MRMRGRKSGLSVSRPSLPIPFPFIPASTGRLTKPRRQARRALAGGAQVDHYGTKAGKILRGQDRRAGVKPGWWGGAH